MPQNEHIELHRKRHGRRLDHEERARKKEAREPRVRLIGGDEINHGICNGASLRSDL